jgi:hypothetical protein
MVDADQVHAGTVERAIAAGEGSDAGRIVRKPQVATARCRAMTTTSTHHPRLSTRTSLVRTMVFLVLEGEARFELDGEHLV